MSTEQRPEPPLDPRVLFAAERTFLAWIRTGLALMGFGFIVARSGVLLRELSVAQVDQLQSDEFSRVTGVALVLIGVALTAGAMGIHLQTVRRLTRGIPLAARPTWLAVVVAALLVVLGLVMTIYLLEL